MHKGGNKSQKRQRHDYRTFDVVETIFPNKIKPQLELSNLALSQKEKGKSILAEFIANCGLKIVNKAPTLEKPCAAFEGGIFQSV